MILTKFFHTKHQNFWILWYFKFTNFNFLQMLLPSSGLISIYFWSRCLFRSTDVDQFNQSEPAFFAIAILPAISDAELQSNLMLRQGLSPPFRFLCNETIPDRTTNRFLDTIAIQCVSHHDKIAILRCQSLEMICNRNHIQSMQQSADVMMSQR